MANDELQAYKAEISKKLKKLSSLFATVCIGDYTAPQIEIPDEDDEFSKLYVGVDMMLNVIHKQLLELKDINHSLGKRVEGRTTEIRTPLNGIIGMSGLLNETRLTPKQQDFLQTIRTSSEMLLSIINDILDFSKMEANKMELEVQNFDLKALLLSSFELVSAKAATKNLNLKLDWPAESPQQVRGDEGRLRHVIMNLLSNAVKFTEKGGVTVRAISENETDVDVCFHLSVIDTGIGIQTDKLGHLFQPFNQVDNSTTRKYGGTGLGLAISKRFVELMGGQIGCESVPGQGSTFWCRLKLEKKNSDLPDVPGSNPKNGHDHRTPLPKLSNRPLHILVAEDNSVNQKVVLLQLQKLGVKADAVGSGVEVIEALKGIPYDLILMDCQMPDMDGYTATAVIRKQDNQRRSIPIIAMTAHAMGGDREKCLKAGMNDYIAKPVRPDDLADLLGKWSSESGREFRAPARFGNRKEKAQTSTRKAAFLPFKLPKGVNDLSLLEELTPIFLKNTPVYLNQMKTAQKQGDANALRMAAHTLKGSCVNLGLDRMATLSRRIEESVAPATGREMDKLLSDLDREFEKISRISKTKDKRRKL